MIANYYLMITELSKIQLTQDDYGDKKKVKLSNRAAKTLQGIEKEMRKDLSRDKPEANASTFWIACSTMKMTA